MHHHRYILIPPEISDLQIKRTIKKDDYESYHTTNIVVPIPNMDVNDIQFPIVYFHEGFMSLQQFPLSITVNLTEMQDIIT